MLESNAAAAPTLSLRDAQRCFDKERRAFLRDLETLRQQLVRKEQLASKASAAASAHAVQLKREISALQAALKAAEAARDDFRAQFTHSSSLLESALDQHQEDGSKLEALTETLRTLEKRHAEALALVQREAAASVSASLDERKALRARVDQLRCKLEKERKAWQGERRPLADELSKARTRLTVLDKELQEARFRETSSVQLRDKAVAEAAAYKRKLEDMTEALQTALAAKSELRSEHLLAAKRFKLKAREGLAALAHAKGELLMLQEDYNGLFRSRGAVQQQNARLREGLALAKTRHEETVAAMERERWELEKRHKKASATCSSCLKTPEARLADEQRKVEAAREQTRLQVAKDMELERWDRFQDVSAKYMSACEQLQVVRPQLDELTARLQQVERERGELAERSEALAQQLARSGEDAQEAARALEESKRTAQTLMDNLNNLTAVAADQSKKLQELEVQRKDESERLDTDRRELREALAAQTAALQQLSEQHAALRRERARHLSESVEAQLSANLLIEEQAHTIDDLLQTKLSAAHASPDKTQPSAPSVSDADADASPSRSSTSSDSRTSVLLALRSERDALEDALRAVETQFRAEKAAWREESDARNAELLRDVARLQEERAKLKRRLDAQAVTIHELTIEGDDEESGSEGDGEDEEDEDPSGYERELHCARGVGDSLSSASARRRSRRDASLVRDAGRS